MTDFPVRPIVKPADLTHAMNGLLRKDVLRKIGPTSGELHRHAATAWNCLKLAAFFEGISLDHVGAYRTLGAQNTLFKQRYSLTPQGRNITRKSNGQIYYLRDGFAPSSTPGASVHGLGLAIDVANASGERLMWLLAGNAEKFGWWWQVKNGPQAEPWHLQYVCGDAPPRGVRNALAVFPELNA
jgi:LAS superfamily LD-carboxypeptidase LdcB